MAHRRVKDIDYDEDEYDDYYSGEEEYGYEGAEPVAVAANNEDELSAEDKEQMRIGTESVRDALGDAFADVTDAAIQEALWHYYYDVGKSVTYLKNQSAPQQAQPKKQKQVSKFDQAATSAAQKPVDIKAGQSEKPAGAPSLMDRLGTRSAQPTSQENTKPGDASQPETRSFPIRKRKSPSPPLPAEDRRPSAPEPTSVATPEPVSKPAENVRAGPSIFASTMCGGSSRRHPSHQDTAVLSQNILPAIYGHDANLANTNAFSASGAKKQASQNKDSKVKSKNLDVVAEHAKAGRKNAASFVVIGHVDHGKSTLMGRLLYDLKVVDQRSLDKFRKEATSIERERGVTVDIATNNFETDKTKFTILDAPGHRDFIPNMIAGASQADFAVLVIDAGTNSFEAGLKGQTREHAQLVRSMGVQRIIVAINKMDSINWTQDRFEEIQQQISAFLTTTGFQQKNIAFIPCSGLTGENVVTPAPEAASCETASIKGIEVDNEAADWAVAGQIVTLHLTEIDPVHLRIADLLCDARKPVANIKAFTTKILAFEHVMPMTVDIHRGRMHVPGRIAQMTCVLDKSSGAITKKKPRVVQPGSVARVRVELDTAVPLEVPGRIVLRSGGNTVAAGLLEEVFA
ncbi:unnamed protein product [Aureobasidium pullulans]|nr:unnamed protein product [Aureobasidium pullulans]